MGTNFYIRGQDNDDDEGHIGKRSAAGAYCWDCRVTLCKGGEAAIHMGNAEWETACPKCGRRYLAEDVESSSAGRELGFNVSEPKPKRGVASCSSFTWAMEPKKIPAAVVDNNQCPTCHRYWQDSTKVIEDEYGHLLTLREFNAMLSECPVRFRDSIGTAFS